MGFMFAAFRSTEFTGFSAKLAKRCTQFGVTRHEGYAETAKVGTIPARAHACAHLTQVEAGAAALFALYETGKAGFNTLFQGCTHFMVS